GAGMRLPDSLLHEILDAEQRVWDRSVRVDPDAPALLAWLKERGIKRGICSNAPFPPAMMRRQLHISGIDALVDAIVFSSEVGRRKPAPELYRAALEAIGTTPERTLFVGDRGREDYQGPGAVGGHGGPGGVGMRAVIVPAHAEEPPPDGVPSIRRLADLRSLV